MRRFVDFHTHSTASDGSYKPAELIALADRAGLAAVALTDHDTVEGLGEARAAAEKFAELRFIPGIEISAQYSGGTMHILGLGIDGNAPGLQDVTRRLRKARDERNPKIVEKLRSMGIDISMQDVLETAERMRDGQSKPIISRVHIAEALRRKGCVSSTDDAFKRYIASGGPAYVDKERLKPSEAIAVIHDSGGLVVLAHPPQLRCENNAQLERILRDLKHAGLAGIEAYHSSHSNEQTRLYMELARRVDLDVCGGSDFHGLGKLDVKIGRPRVPLGGVTGKIARRFLSATDEHR